MIIRNAIPSDATFMAKCVMAGMHFYDFESDMPKLISLYSSLGFNLADHRHAFGVDFQRMVYNK